MQKNERDSHLTAPENQDLCKEIGKLVQLHRKEKKMTQEILAEHVNISVDSLKRYESGKTPVRSDVLYQIAHVLDVPIQDLFPAEPEKAQKKEQDNIARENVIKSAQLIQNELQRLICIMREG